MNDNSPEIWCSLIHSEMLADLSGLLDHLYPARPRPNDSNTFVFEWHIMVRPVCCVIHFAPEVGRAFEVWNMSVSCLVVMQVGFQRFKRGYSLFGCEAHICEQPFTERFCSIRTTHPPSSMIRIPVRICHIFVILDVLFQVPLFLNMLEILLQLTKSRKPLGEGKILPDFLVEELISW